MQKCSWCLGLIGAGSRHFLPTVQAGADTVVEAPAVFFMSICDRCLGSDKPNPKFVAFLDKAAARGEISEEDAENILTVAAVMEK